MSAVQDVVSVSASAGFLGILAKLVVDWVRGYRKDRADDQIAAGSVLSTLTERNLSAADAQIVFLEKANGLERASYERRIKALEDDVSRLTHERDALRGTVETMRDQMDRMQEQLTQMKSQLDALPRPTPS